MDLPNALSGLVPIEQKCFRRRLKAGSVEFGQRTGFGILFQADGRAMAKLAAVRVELLTLYVDFAQRNGDVSGWTVGCRDTQTTITSLQHIWKFMTVY